MRCTRSLFALTWALGLACLLGGTRPARAQAGDAAREQARRLAQQAPAAFEHKDYRKAQELLEQAYALYPSAKLKYSLGRVYEAEGRAEEAAQAYQYFLDHVPPDERVSGQGEEVGAALRRLGKRLGRIQLKGPAGAWFQVDGGERQALPVADVWIAPGDHKVTCAGGDLDVSVKAGGTAAVYLLAPPTPPPVAGRETGRATTAAPSGRPLRLLKWVAAGAGLALLVSGAAVWGVDGRAHCDLHPRQVQCPQVLSTRGAGIGLVTSGLVVLGGAGVMFGLDYRASKQGEKTAMLTLGGRF